ncbi:SIR2 family protein [Acinetobacter sp. WU_MDCI_Abxb74]|uniref:SIR2 family protein n=1 Tax=Acinetobacter sp. WU_MDCI_Abxb74 TaxID=2850072 RepID=UPI0021CD302B|nr:SIR2 family protein [Acinetobacter sp. WU_MDCI_Abxb74]MCU4424165.1 SIR2 family protein [Acinetobacter sp. WU_MDCI_Abxb74]
MRFTKTGPNIPNELIEAQKKGELLFFCGAGVSVPAGLPTFYSLTKKVAEKLNALDDEYNEISQLLSNYQFDRTFAALKRTYGNENVDSILLNELKLTKTPLLTNHENLLKLSINEEKKPFLITTNFDLLFEKVDKKIKTFVPPYLPDLQSREALSGIVYLHGKWIDPKKNEPNNLIISSQDFGSAYLSHGWATRFLSNLLTRRTVVLIGYSGDDTLVRYLLEGLNSENVSSKNRIYAFERGEQSKIDKKWSQLGAVGISYPDHNDLWNTITEWAKYAGDEDKWNEYIFELSQKSPKDLEAFERGQVTNFISTQKGANKFQLFEPAPSAEWIYVFDKYIRLGKNKKVKDETGHEYLFDPIDLYGIDSDLNRPEIELVPDHLKNDIGEDFIDSLNIDPSCNLRERMSNLEYKKVFYVNSRITSLIRWFVKVIEQPMAISWVAKQYNLHPLIIREIEEKFSDNINKLPEYKIIFFKNLILSQKLLERQPTITWYQLKFLVERNNNIFNESNLRDLESLLEPTLKINNNFPNSYYSNNLEEQNLNIDFSVQFIGFDHDSIKVNNSSLISVINILTKSLIKYINLIKFSSLRISSFLNFEYPVITLEDFDNEMQNTYENTGKIIVWLSYLIHKQIQINEKEIHRLSKEWPRDDSYIFNRLRLFIWTYSQSLQSYNIGKNIQNFSDDLFWSSILEADLFKFISKKWDNISNEDRLKIEDKIIKYYPYNKYFEKDRFEQSKIYHIGRLLSQIENTKTGLSESSKNYLLKIKTSDEWQESFLDEEPYSPNAIAGLIKTNISAEMLDLRLISNSTELFDKIEKIENDRSVFLEQNKPFIGLIQRDISYTLNLLLKELELNNLRENFWQQLFYNFPENATLEEKINTAKTILLLPPEIIFTCRFCLSRWINEKLVYTCISDQALFWQIWDYVFNTLNTMGIEATKSSFGDIIRGGKIIKKSRKTLEYARDSPIGKLVNAIFLTFNIWELDPKICKSNYLSRFELALKSVGEGADHAAVMIAYRFNFIFTNYKKWAEYNLIPLLNIENPLSEPVWHGLIYTTPFKNTSLKIKPYVIQLVKEKPEWLGNEKLKYNLATYIVLLSYWSHSSSKYYSDLELRNLIRSFDNDMLSHSLWTLNQIITKEKNWLSFGRYFIKNIWPKELIFQSSRISERMLNLILETSDEFIDINRHIIPYLGKIDTGSLFLYRLIKDDKVFLLEKYPEEILLLLDKVIGSRIEHYDHYLKKILDKLITVKPTIKNNSSWRRLKEIAG